jgi:hypothetical protein
MLGITGFAGWEALTGHAIVENSMFFHPNLLLPALVAGYTAFNAIYRVENSDRYVFQISKTSEGEAMLENFKLGMPSEGGSEKTMKKVEDAAETAKKLANGAKELYNKLSDSYLDYSTNNIKKD